jgi:ribosomal protein L37AE/L43A
VPSSQSERHTCPGCGSRADHRAWETGGFFTCVTCADVFKPEADATRAEILGVLTSTAGLVDWSQDERDELADRLVKAVSG